MAASVIEVELFKVNCSINYWSENSFWWNGCRFRPKIPFTKGVSTACAKWYLFCLSRWWNISNDLVTMRNSMISPVVGISSLCRLEWMFPFAYFRSFGHSLCIYLSACLICFNTCSLGLLLWTAASMHRSERKSCWALSWLRRRASHASSSLDTKKCRLILKMQAYPFVFQTKFLTLGRRENFSWVIIKFVGAKTVSPKCHCLFRHGKYRGSSISEFLIWDMFLCQKKCIGNLFVSAVCR